jgi:molecular chaperone GrpE
MHDPDDKSRRDTPESRAEADARADAAAEYARENAAHYADELAAAAEHPLDDPDAAPAGDGLEAAVARLEAEKAQLTERFVRIAADMENLRKRTDREIADSRKYAVSKFAADILGVSDNLQRAREAANQGEGALEAIVEGIDVTAREMERILEKHGVVKIPAEGERFDPNLHQAMFEVPDESVPEKTVVQLVQDGYTIGDRVLRAAMVGVSRGGPKAAPAASDSASEPQDIDTGDATGGDDGPPQAA